MRRRLIVESDGGSRGNPGVAGYGALVRDAGTGALLAERAEPLGLASNNVAEYTGLLEGLRAAVGIDPGADIEARMDSKLVVEQMSGRWKIKHEDMRRLALEVRDLVVGITEAGGSVRYTWVPREQNAAADALSNRAMDGETIVNDFGGESRLDAIPPPAPAEPQSTPESATLSGSVRHPVARIVLVRHGVTPFTEAGRLDGRGGADPSLSGTGRAQARAAGRSVAALVGGSEVRVITSSLARAVETGAAVAAALGVDPDIDADWDEQGFGDWDGVGMTELLGRQRNEFVRLRDDPTYRRPGGESHEELTERVLPAFHRVVEAGGLSVVVCHRKPIMVVLADVLGVSFDRAWRLATAPGSLTALEVGGNGAISVAFTNRT